MMMHDGMGAGHLLWMVLMAALIVIPFWQICRKAGYSGFWSLLMLVPLANIIFVYVLAFANWPALRRGQ